MSLTTRLAALTVTLFALLAAGDAFAQNNLGLRYAKGQAVPQDYGEAMRWFRKAADQGEAFAQNNLGLMFVKGQGVPKDDIQAYARFSVAVALGHNEAAENVAEMDRLLTPAQKIAARALAERLLEALKDCESARLARS